jgi:signal transduction histidine kinase
MFSVHAQTLSIAVGVGNLIFALLATLYIAKTQTRNPALELWRWGRFLSGCAFLTNVTSTSQPNLIPLEVGNLLHLVVGGLDIAAYSLLLERKGWRKPLLLLMAVSLSLLLAVAIFDERTSMFLLTFSMLGVLFYSILAYLLFHASNNNLIIKVIALIDLMMCIVLLARVMKGLAFGPLVRFENDIVTLLLYSCVYLVVIINGFGFLLLAKQQDDKKLYRAMDELAKSDEQRYELLTQASHEFRTPAAMIKASLDSLQFMKDELPTAVQQRLENIRRATQRLTDLSNALLTSDRLNNESMLFQPQQINANTALHEAIKLYPNEAGIELNLPEEPIFLYADPMQLRIAVQNLIDNALEHHVAERGPLLVSLNEVETKIEISVADCGSGIPDQEKAQVFKRFYSQHQSLARGVGLSIVFKIAIIHGGEVIIRNNMPNGTIMVLRLPKSKSTQTTEPSRSSEANE